MLTNPLYKYMIMLAVTGAITIGTISYAILKNDVSKRMDKMVAGVIVLDLVALIVFIIKFWTVKDYLCL